ncbi:MAG: 16S rRNA (uracil(1498)-N(3))-methyltransferase [Bacilli bacterium]|nr:16S rRNA (uracil(1498)-N(3))-methyltransferase [Bacilli bacterium]
MQHYLGRIEGNEAFLSEEETHHLLHVRRGELHEEVEVGDGETVYLCEIVSLNPLKLAVKSEVEFNRELDRDVTLGFALLKGDHNDLVVLKGTELGAKAFVPFLSERTVVKPKNPHDAKIERWTRIATEGAKQCRRNSVPSVSDYIAYKNLLDYSADIKLLAYEGEAGKGTGLLERLSRANARESVLIVIGPEGGFTAKEVGMALAHGFELVSLGNRILRAETAALYSLSIISALSEKENK